MGPLIPEHCSGNVTDAVTKQALEGDDSFLDYQAAAPTRKDTPSEMHVNSQSREASIFPSAQDCKGNASSVERAYDRKTHACISSGERARKGCHGPR